MDLETFDPSLLHLSFFEVIERYPSAIFDLERLVDSVPDSVPERMRIKKQ